MKGISNIVRGVQAFGRELARKQDSEPEVAPAEPARRPRIGLALGGGFARGLSHIGVLKVFEEENIPIDYLAGTSVGSVIGAAYASGISAKELEEIAALVRFKDFARWTVSRFGFCTNDRMVQFLHKLLKVKTFEELRIPLAVAATDFVTGDPVVFREGSLIDPVRASCAYPGMFLPVSVNGRLMVDGLLAHSVPTTPLKQMGADRVVAIYLSAHWVMKNGPRHVFDVIGQCFSIAQEKMCGIWKVDADITMEPEIGQFGYDDFVRAPELIRAGEAAARAALPTIRQWLPAMERETAAVMPKVPAVVTPANQPSVA